MPKRSKEDRYEIDPVDGLSRELVGSWAREKHLRLAHYVNISRAARRKFDGNSSFIDLYCGPGRARIRDTEIVLQGGTLVAATEAARSVPFGQIHLADLDPVNVHACKTRLERDRLGPLHSYVGTAEQTAKQVVSKLSPSGLHFAFLDPYNVLTLPFAVISTLAQAPRMDLLIHLSAMDLTRNVKRIMANGELDQFAPGWKAHANPADRNDIAVRCVVQHWCNLIRGLGYEDVSEKVELVSGDKNQPLYWLVLASRNALGTKFWGEVSNVTAQQRLF
ncbi:three-Cys-motif partner protein [Pseudoxanthomonas sp. GM95]|uniref:three-Cys-motif partner protein TcmP n=1 Tax=Pseudoxanthomonas sp. GM95 TaxID=1881043 RepID=UPI0008C5B139|nr:three-Cys-motif partner protein TcmP [Pseudoxanthomonas sp. GM95]SEM57839.1 three-Cys-motif partner protein [Pseudoxanthomonas sp. GM95]